MFSKKFIMDENLNLEKITKEYIKFDFDGNKFVLPYNLIEPFVDYIRFIYKYFDSITENEDCYMMFEKEEEYIKITVDEDIFISANSMICTNNIGSKSDDFLSILESISCHTKDIG